MAPQDVASAMKTKAGYVLLQVPEEELPGPERAALEIWSPLVPEIDFPVMKVGKGGERYLSRYPTNEAADRLIAEAESHWRQRRLAEAAALYQRALKLQPEYYPALLDLGDVAAAGGNLEEALARYDRAIRASPLDYRGRLLRGNALAEMGRAEQALDAYAAALALSPRNPRVLDAIQARQEKLGIRLVRSFFSPRGLVRPLFRKTEVQADLERSPHWGTWAACKAVWRVEEGRRLRMTGDEVHRFTMLEELECLGVLLQGYLVMRVNGKVEEEPELERMARIASAGLLQELVLYEMASRKSPHAVALLDDERRARVEGFLRRFAFDRPGNVREHGAAR